MDEEMSKWEENDFMILIRSTKYKTVLVNDGAYITEINSWSDLSFFSLKWNTTDEITGYRGNFFHRMKPVQQAMHLS